MIYKRNGQVSLKGELIADDACCMYPYYEEK